MAFLLFFELPPNKKYSELHLVNPHSSKQMTRSHFNAITTTSAKRCYRPRPNTRSISTTRVIFFTISVSWIYDLRCSLVTNPPLSVSPPRRRRRRRRPAGPNRTDPVWFRIGFELGCGAESSHVDPDVAAMLPSGAVGWASFLAACLLATG